MTGNMTENTPQVANKKLEEAIGTEKREWVEAVWEKTKNKLYDTSARIGANFPYTTKNGKYEEFAVENDIAWWTNGFWPCMMLQMYHATGDTGFLSIAQECEDKLDEALYDYDKLIHDVGFMWDISAFADYRLTGHEKSRKRGLMAAAVLMSRYKVDGGFIRAWNLPEAQNWAIIDCMMNLPLLYRASEILGDRRFARVAENHADTTMRHFVRPDGSCEHVLELDERTGEPVGKPHTQGYSVDSSWSRGQAWALYGFALSYLFTGRRQYLDTAKRIAHYFLANVGEDGVPDSDFRAPKDPVVKDASAGACAACGLIEIARLSGVYERRLYLDGAWKLLHGLAEHCCDFSKEEMSIVQMGTEAFHSPTGVHIPMIYSDSFFLEALLKLRGNDFLFW